MSNTTTRRTILAGFAAMPLLAMARPGLALTTDEATALVQRMSEDIVKTINSGKADKAMYGEFEKLLGKYADMDVIARFALGPAARSASAGELNAYTGAFKTYLSRKYGQRFREFIGGDIKVKGARADKKAVVVSATAILRGQSPVAVDFQVSDRGGSAKVFNVVIEGINLLTTERTEIGAMLDKQGGSMSKLTAELKRQS